MVSLLLIISFLLHIVLLIAVYYLHQQLQVTRQNREQELESLFTEFLQEMKRENELLQHKLIDNKINTNSEYTPSPNNNKVTVAKKVMQKNNAETLYPLDVDKQDKLETSIEGQVFQLYKQGQSIEKIARNLHRGQTEIELILKFQKNNMQNS